MSDIATFLQLLGDSGASSAAATNANELNRQFSALLTAFNTFANKMGQASTAYTPTITAGTGTFTSVSSTGRFMRLGKMCWVTIDIQITTNGTAAADIRASLPFMPNAQAGWAGREYQLVGKMLQGSIFFGVQTLFIENYDNSYPGANGNKLLMSGWYETT